MIRKWEKIKDFDNYMITDQGEVFRQSQVKPTPGNSGGYAVVSLSQQGKKKSITIHKLVLEAFVGKAPPNHVAHHKDNNRRNNALNNLEWVSRSQHAKIHPSGKGGKRNHKDIASDDPWRGEKVWNSKLNATQIRQIRNLWEDLTQDYNLTRLAFMFNVTPSTISKIVNRKSWQHIV